MNEWGTGPAEKFLTDQMELVQREWMGRLLTLSKVMRATMNNREESMYQDGKIIINANSTSLPPPADTSTNQRRPTMEACRYHLQPVRLLDNDGKAHDAREEIDTTRYGSPAAEQVKRAVLELQRRVMRSMRETPCCAMSSTLLRVGIGQSRVDAPRNPGHPERWTAREYADVRGVVTLLATWVCDHCAEKLAKEQAAGGETAEVEYHQTQLKMDRSKTIGWQTIYPAGTKVGIDPAAGPDRTEAARIKVGDYVGMVISLGGTRSAARGVATRVTVNEVQVQWLNMTKQRKWHSPKHIRLLGQVGEKRRVVDPDSGPHLIEVVEVRPSGNIRCKDTGKGNPFVYYHDVVWPTEPEAENIKVGDRVWHVQHGDGCVTNLTTHGGIRVAFRNGRDICVSRVNLTRETERSFDIGELVHYSADLRPRVGDMVKVDGGSRSGRITEIFEDPMGRDAMGYLYVRLRETAGQSEMWQESIANAILTERKPKRS